ncbi:MAG: acetate--CoA ligase family protein, partial [Planctomycetota bacterium]
IVKNTLTIPVLEQCAEKGVKVAIVNTSGFKEIGAEGQKMEDELVAAGKRLGVRLFGPNCQGVMNTDPKASMFSNFTYSRIKPGHISIMAQGGGVAEVINNYISELGIGIRMYASNGNACDISIPELIEYMGDDDDCRVIVVHVESLAKPHEFLEVCSKVGKKKPILGFKSGKTLAGAKAVASHTGGMIREDTTTEVIFEKAGIPSFDTVQDLCEAAIAFSYQPAPKGRRVGLVTNAGSPAILAVDEAVKLGLEIPTPTAETQNLLREALFGTSSVHNPIDMMATASPEDFGTSVRAMLNDPNNDSLIVCFITPFFADCEGIAKSIVEETKKTDKPVIMCVMTNETWQPTLDIIREGGLPIYYFAESAARALHAMVKYGEYASRDLGTPPVYKADSRRAKEIISGAAKGFLESGSVSELLDAYQIPRAESTVAASREDAIAAAEKIGYPVALKVEAKDIVHKTDVGGIKLNLNNPDELGKACDEFLNKFSKHKPQLLIQEFLGGGQEVIVGASKSDVGHTIMFGLGGIHVEIFKDVVFKLAPISTEEALDAIKSIKGYPLLAGARGRDGVDINAVAEIMTHLSQMLKENPEIEELDFNPVMAFPDGSKTKIVDARISTGK